MTNYYILSTSPSEKIDGTSISALEIITSRLVSGRWPLFERTPNRKNLAPGDICLIYEAGPKSKSTHSQHFHAAVQVIEISSKITKADIPEHLFDIPKSIARIITIQKITPPEPIHKHFERLTFISKNRAKWGITMQGGCKKISENDYLELTGKQFI